MRADIVMQMLAYEKFQQDYEAKFIDLNKDN